ncbi:hypothetical protein Ahy_A03g012361 [Arachis hypogaea]|uniref:Magnesium transporter n=1 Tax=Arachis hypogaea TaxID=3818 RepID=A0A445DT64_ARAHY|nr:hypothetical protein Ahy_A03g012361 [Arachis hypogaea]
MERVRQIKGRLVAITNRVQKVRDELEHLSDDDDDMDEVYLTEKLQQLHSSSASSINDDDVDNDHHNQLDVDDRHVYMLLVGVSRDNRASTTYSTTTKHLDMEELEMLLEAYFVQINGTLNKLCTLREYVDDTEDYINIILDDKQNYLLQMGVMLTTATLVVSAFVVVAGIFGMNIHIELFDSNITRNEKFFWTVGGRTARTIFLHGDEGVIFESDKTVMLRTYRVDTLDALKMVMLSNIGGIGIKEVGRVAYRFLYVFPNGGFTNRLFWIDGDQHVRVMFNSHDDSADDSVSEGDSTYVAGSGSSSDTVLEDEFLSETPNSSVGRFLLSPPLAIPRLSNILSHYQTLNLDAMQLDDLLNTGNRKDYNTDGGMEFRIRHRFSN